MNKTPFAKNTPEPNSVEWMMQEAARLGYVYADNRFLLWIDTTLSRKIGDVFRSLIVNTRQWMLRNNLPIGKIRLDDLISYAFIGIGRAATGKTSDPYTHSALAMSMQSVTSSPGFKRWFKGSKVVDANKNPLTVFHGTPGTPFTVFDKSLGQTGPYSFNPIAKYGFFFSDVRDISESLYAEGKGSVMDVFLSIKKPKKINMWKDFSSLSDENGKVLDEKVKPWIENLKKQGYDGLILESHQNESVYREFMVFEPEQIKSASLNNGDFDPTNPDIRFSKPSPSLLRSMDSPDNPEWIRFTLESAYADVEPDATESSVSIHNISSAKPGKGFAERLLLALKQRFGRVHTTSVTEDSVEAIGFWQRMLDKGIVESAVRTDGLALTPTVYVIPGQVFDLGFTQDGNQIREYNIDGCKLIIDAKTDRIDLSSLRVPRAKRGHGLARNAMNALIKQADEQGVTIYLGASGLDKKTSTSQLVEFYTSLGFEKTGRSINPLGEPEMVRVAKKFELSGASAVKSVSVDVFHGTNEAFDKFSVDTQGYGALGAGFYFTPSKEEAADFGSRIIRATVYLQNPFVLSSLPGVEREEWNGRFENDPWGAQEQLIELGYDGVIDDVYTNNHVVAFRADQISIHCEPMTPGMKELANWLDGTKAVDAHDKPLVVYHGTTKNFVNFRTRKNGRGIYFTSSYSVADTYASAKEDSNGCIKQCYLSMKNPLVVDGNGGHWAEIPFDGREASLDYIAQVAKERGHDGVIARNIQDLSDMAVPDGVLLGDTYVVYSSSQAHVLPEAKIDLKKPLNEANDWFKNSEVVDASGNPKTMYHGTTANFTTFEPNSRGIYFVSPSQEWVADFLKGPDGRVPGGATVMPVHVSASNIFDYENKNHVKKVAMEASLGSIAIGEIKKGSWQRMEDRTFILTLKKMGFDGLYVKEKGVKNLAVFSPDQIKSAIVNKHLHHETTESDYISDSSGVRLSKRVQVSVTSPTESITEASLVSVCERSFPHLTSCLETIFERGRAGKKGGAVIIESADPLEIASEIAERSGLLNSSPLASLASIGQMSGCYEPHSGLTYLIAKNLTPESGVSVLMHELTHSQQRKKVDEAALSLINDREGEPNDVRDFLDRVAERMKSVQEYGNAKECLAYIIEQAAAEYIARPTMSVDTEISFRLP